MEETGHLQGTVPISMLRAVMEQKHFFMGGGVFLQYLVQEHGVSDMAQ